MADHRVVRIYAIVSDLILPQSFRQQYGKAMVDAFRDLHQNATAGRRAAIAIREIGLLVRASFSVRAEMRRERQKAKGTHRSSSGAGVERAGSLIREVRFAFRTIVRQPAFALFAIITLALGIGANSAIFSVIEIVLLNRPPFPDSERIVGVFETSERIRRGVTSPANYRDWEAGATDVFEAIAAVRGMQYHLTSNAAPERHTGREVSPAFFRVMGVAPLLGRPLLEGDDRSDTRVVVIGHGLWRRLFGADSGAVGSDIVLNGEPFTVVGVMPVGFAYPRDTEIWTPLVMEPEMWNRRGWYFLTALARLRPGVTLEQAQTALDGVAAQQSVAFPEARDGRGISIEQIHDTEVSLVRANLWMLFGAVGLVLLIACTNVANLMLSRAVARTREMCLRAALGAERGQLLRQLLLESGVLGIVGGALGLVLAAAGLQLFATLSPAWFPRIDEIQINLVVFLYTLGISLVASFVFGIVPALRLSGVAASNALRTTGRSLTRKSVRLGQMLVVGETALAFVLVLGAGLLLRSFHRLTIQPLGFDPNHILTIDVPLPSHSYTNPEQQSAFYSQLVERARGTPGVVNAAATHNLPFSMGWYGTSFTLQLGDAAGTEIETSSGSHRVSSGYFETLQLPLTLGRTLLASDRDGSTPVAVINQAFVDKLLDGTDPLRARIRLRDEPVPFEIVGVVGNAKHVGLDDEPEPAVYFSMLQRPTSSMLVFLRTNSDPLALASVLTAHVRALDATVPVTGVSTMEQSISDSLDQPRFYAVLLSIFGGTALVLACIGVYGVLSFQVAQRTHEIGVRMALGAKTGTVMRLVVGRGLALAGPGVLIGLAGGFALTNLLEGLLYEIEPTDPLTFMGLTGLFVGIALLASYLPARRGTRVDPVHALRAE